LLLFVTTGELLYFRFYLLVTVPVDVDVDVDIDNNDGYVDDDYDDDLS